MHMSAAFRHFPDTRFPEVEHEPRAAAVLCYPGFRLADIAAPFRLLSRAMVTTAAGDAAAAFQVGLVAPSRGPVRGAGGERVVADYALADVTFALDDLIVPCTFLGSSHFATAPAIEALATAVRRAGRVGLIAASRVQALRAQAIFEAASSRSNGAFRDAFRPRDAEAGTEFVADGRLLWAIGPDAGPDLAMRLVGAATA
jgi:transcriptional regulator GlxA family with amidase domain